MAGDKSLPSKCFKCGLIPHSQDSLYGEEIRLHNKTMSGQWRCSVCGNTKGEIKKVEETGKKKKKGK